MNSFFNTHRKGLVLAFNLFFWLITCVFFVRFATLRPICNTNIYKEFLPHPKAYRPQTVHAGPLWGLLAGLRVLAALCLLL